MDKPRITALNKIDLLLNSNMTWDEAAAINYLSAQPAAMGKNTVLISAAKKWGLNKLLELISSTLTRTMQPV
jgi:GTP-binding protein HflX